MNKLIIGGVLVTMMGGTPTVTYFLTQKEETSKSREEVNVQETGQNEVSGKPPASGGTPECKPQETNDNCQRSS